MGVAIQRLTRQIAARAEQVSAAAFARAAFALLAVVVLAAYAPAFARWFFRDDFFLLSFARYDWSMGEPLKFVTVTHNGLFTPLGNVLFWLEYSLFGFIPTGYRLVSLFLHALNAGLVGLLVLTMTRRRVAALAAALLFAATFSVQEAVSWIAAYVHLLSLTFLLLAMLFTARWVRDHRRADLYLALVCVLPGLLVKEDFVTAPAVLLMFVGLAHLRRMINRRDALLAAGLFIGIGAGYAAWLLLWHTRVASIVQMGQFQLGWHSLANYRYLIGLLIPPPDYIPFVSLMNRLLPGFVLQIYTVVGWALLLPLVFFLLWRLWKGSLLEQAAVLLILITFAPFSMSTIGISMRYLYMPYAGFAILAGLAINRLMERRNSAWVLALLAVFLLGNFAGTWVWNLRQGRDTAEKRAIIQTVRQDWDAGRIDRKQVCIFGLPRSISDVTIAVPVFTDRLPRPEVYMDAVFCPEGAFPYRYQSGGVTPLE